MRAFAIAAFVLMTACAPSVQDVSAPGGPVLGAKVGTGEFCGGMTAVGCADPGDFCKLPISAQCGAADAGGVCAPMPEMCTQDYMPVCGCDGQDYPNECAAHAQGVSAAYAGACTS